MLEIVMQFTPAPNYMDFNYTVAPLCNPTEVYGDNVLVRSYKLGELLTVSRAKLNLENNVVGYSFTQICNLLEPLVQMPAGKAFDDLRVSDALSIFGYALFLTDNEYNFGVICDCNSQECGEKNNRRVIPITELSLPDINVPDITIEYNGRTLTFTQETIRSLKDYYQLTKNGVPESLAFATSILVDGKDLQERYDIVYDLPPRVVKEAELTTLKAVQFDSVEAVCPKCGNKVRLGIPFDLKDILP